MESDESNQFDSPWYQINEKELFYYEIITSDSSILGVFVQSFL
jgi:hypothetical protein